MWKIVFISCVVILSTADASTIRSSFFDNINSGLKMLGISNKVADLVSQSFAPSKSNGKSSTNRQDAIVIGDVPSAPTDSSFMGGMLQLLGFDSSKIGAVAINGIIFIAQMVRYGAARLMDYVTAKSLDIYRFVDYIGERMNETSTAAPTAITSEIRF